MNKRVLEIRLVADRVRAAEHVELGLVRELRERPAVEQGAQRRHEVVRILGRDDQADALRVVRVDIQRTFHAVLGECGDCGLRVGAAAERGEFHEQAPVERDLLAAAPAFLGEVERLRIVGRFGRGGSIAHSSSECTTSTSAATLASGVCGRMP